MPLRNVEYVGALLPASNGGQAELDPRIRTWPGRLVVVSQGTIDNRDLSKLIQPTLFALEGHGRLVVAVTGGIGTEAIRRRFIRDDVVIADYIPFGEMFGRTDVFVTNGGHGSAMLALSHRVPMVVAGTREGKNDVNVRLEAAGVARNLRTERPKPAQILAAVEAVLDGRRHAGAGGRGGVGARRVRFARDRRVGAAAGLPGSGAPDAALACADGLTGLRHRPRPPRGVTRKPVA